MIRRLFFFAAFVTALSACELIATVDRSMIPNPDLDGGEDMGESPDLGPDSDASIPADGSILADAASPDAAVGDADTMDATLVDAAVDAAPTDASPDAFSVPRVSVTVASTSAASILGNGASQSARLSADGTKAVFHSSASNLVPGDTNGWQDVFVKDLLTGAVTRASVLADGTQFNSWSQGASFSPDGTKVVFVTYATNVGGDPSNEHPKVVVKDLVSGAIAIVSENLLGELGDGPSLDSPSFANDGDHVLFGSDATNLLHHLVYPDGGVPDGGVDGGVSDGGMLAGFDTNAAGDVFLKNLVTGALTRVSVAAGGVEAAGASFSPSLSPDGTKVAFVSYANNLVAGDTNVEMDVFVVTLASGAVRRISVSNDGDEADWWSYRPYFSQDSARVLFESDATNLVPDDTNFAPDVFLFDLVAGTISRVSTDALGAQIALGASWPGWAPSGDWILFHTDAPLDSADTNEHADVYVKHLASGAVYRVSVGAGGGVGNGRSAYASFASAAPAVVFESLATNLVPSDTNGAFDIFVASLTF